MRNDKIKIGIIGAGKTGKPLIELLARQNFVEIVKVAEIKENAPGLKVARAHKIPWTIDFMEIARMGKEVDLIIEVTGVKEVRRQLRNFMVESQNIHTVIVPELVAILLVSMAKGQLVETFHGYQRY